MKQILLLAFCVVFGTTTSAPADPMADATYIVEQHISSGNYEEQLALISQNILAKMRPAFERLGAEIVDPDRFVGELVGDHYSEFMSKIRDASIIAYHEILTPEELTALSNFYRSDEGQSLLVQGLSEETLKDSVAFFGSGAGKRILTHMPELMAQIDGPIQEVQERINELFSMNRMADIMEMEGIISFEDEGRRQLVVDALREAG